MAELSGNTKPLIFIFITVMIDTIGLGIVIPVLPQLLTGLTVNTISVAAQYGGALMVVYALTHFFFAPILGNLSDAYGRRPVLLLSLGALGIDYVLMGFAPTIAWLFIGRLIAGAAGATFAVANAYIPDTSAPEDRANPVGSIIQMNKFPMVVGLIIAILFFQTAHDAHPSIWSFYTIEKFDWTPSDIGLSLALVGISMALVQGVLIRFILPRLGEKKSTYFGYFMGAIGFAGFAFADTGTAMLLWILPWSLMGIAGPALRAIIANQVPDEQQGELSGAIASMISLTAIFSPVIMTQTFGYFASENASIYFPGAPYLLAAALVVLTFICVHFVLRRGQSR